MTIMSSGSKFGAGSTGDCVGCVLDSGCVLICGADEVMICVAHAVQTSVAPFGLTSLTAPVAVSST